MLSSVDSPFGAEGNESEHPSGEFSGTGEQMAGIPIISGRRGEADAAEGIPIARSFDQRLLLSPTPVLSRDNRSVLGGEVPEIESSENMAIRYRLFNRLDPGGSHLRMPSHVIPAIFFSILPFDDFKDVEGKQSSLVTIFSIWNTMMGTR
ncbi:hypothetical protein niasHS_010708 [Heterodera schachtii]|uniref:Uncharacterized protein n=1 Tax=Heterodera schachtii TaxID=97005 RepID=A0ABD2IUJ1_HETSC